MSRRSTKQRRAARRRRELVRQCGNVHLAVNPALRAWADAWLEAQRQQMLEFVLRERPLMRAVRERLKP